MMDCIYLVSRYNLYLPYLPGHFMDPVCEQGIISKSPTDVTDLAMYLVACSYTHIHRKREHLRYLRTNKNVCIYTLSMRC